MMRALIILLTAFCSVYCAPAASGRYAMATDQVFQLPRLGDTVPEEWSDWVEPAPAPEFPFEFRWRLVFTDVPGRVP